MQNALNLNLRLFIGCGRRRCDGDDELKVIEKRRVIGASFSVCFKHNCIDERCEQERKHERSRRCCTCTAK